MNKTLVVFDTNVIVSALLTPFGNPARTYRMFLSGTIELVYNEEILFEYMDVLKRPRLRIPSAEVEKVLSAVRNYGKQIDPVQSKIKMIDEDDRIFYDTANYAGAYLITGNVKHYPQESFIMSPKEFLML
jgi:putative PIN family toxin of toxin-antitoxin system